MGLNVAVRESEHPLDSFQIQSLNARVIPRLVGMAQGRGEHPALAIALHPRNRKVAIGALHVRIGEIELAGIHTRQDVHLFTGIRCSVLIHLVPDRELVRQVLHRREIRPLDDHRRVEHSPRVVVEVGADHLAVLGPAEE